jgi:type VI protein secretion system component VasK
MTSFLATLILTAVFTLGIGFVAWIVAGAAAELKKQKKLEAKRRTEEATRIVRESAPELSTLRKAVTVLRDFVADATRYRPSFSSPFDVLFLRGCEGSGDGPDPQPWVKDKT